MSLLDLRNEPVGYLRGQTTIVRKVGSQINVGERFTLRLTATNVAPPGSRIFFTDASYDVVETEYADLLTPTRDHTGRIGAPFPDRRFLAPGISTWVDLEFEARRSFSDWWHDLWNAEPVARTAVSAFLDVQRFFAVAARAEASHEIDPA